MWPSPQRETRVARHASPVPVLEAPDRQAGDESGMARRNQQSSSLRNEIIALKRERIIDTAVSLIYEKGYENTTLDAVGERLGVTKPFIYSHFASKSELLAEICSRGIRSSIRAIDSVEHEPDGLSCRERLRLVAERFVVAVLESQKHIAIFSREEKNLAPSDYKRISGYRREFDKKLTTLLDDGVRAGEFGCADTRIASLAIGGLVSWSYIWYRPHGRLKLDEVAAEISTLILGMVKAKPPETKSDAANP
jgi:TetR/AcrR family transcriptional regulator, cholesterol catabolism regulator